MEGEGQDDSKKKVSITKPYLNPKNPKLIDRPLFDFFRQRKSSHQDF